MAICFPSTGFSVHNPDLFWLSYNRSAFMKESRLILSRRIGKTPFENRVFEQGARLFTVYNHAPLASVFRSSQEDYEHLCEHVQIWDVSCQRQVEVTGRDALKLVELVTPRDISRCRVGQCMYAILVDEQGGIVNDPLLLKLADDRYWVSISDSGVLLWLKGIACGRKLDVDVFMPDVSPLAIQGPKADDLMAEIVGEEIRELQFFRYVRARIADMDLIIARSGWGGQGGFEIYLEDSAKGLALWDAIWQVGQKYHIRAGCPNQVDRIERGLLSYGNDMTLADNPYEIGLDRFFDLEKQAECLSYPALGRILRAGIKNALVYILVSGDELSSPRHTWNLLDSSGHPVGIVTSLAYSRKYASNIAFAKVQIGYSEPGNILSVEPGCGERRRVEVVRRSWERVAPTKSASRI